MAGASPGGVRVLPKMLDILETIKGTLVAELRGTCVEISRAVRG